MPELPEVETIRRGLEKLVRGRTIQDVRILDPFVLTGFTPSGRPRRSVSSASFRKSVVGKKIVRIVRRGKYLVLEFPDRSAVVIHLRMTGRLLVRAPEGGERAVFELDSGPELCFSDTRRFGEIVFSKQWEKEPGIADLGPEPLEGRFDAAVLKERFGSRSTAVHSALLNQKLIAGLGNIYVTEALFKSKISPFRAAGRIGPDRLEALAGAIRSVLEQSIDNGGYSMWTYVDALGRKGRSQMFTVCYGKDGLPCSVCRTPLKRAVLTGRGTAYCPRCQK
jgi:formamidopyrimidine-DNA glycosylase